MGVNEEKSGKIAVPESANIYYLHVCETRKFVMAIMGNWLCDKSMFPGLFLSNT